MKKTTLLHARLSYCIARLGHTDSITICDAGLPIPTSIERIDLALSENIPDFISTLKAVSSEMFVERILLATEIKQKNPQILTALLQHISLLEQQQGNRITVEYVPHEEFKRQTHTNKAIIRSGECSPYANVMLYSGVPF